MAAYLIGEIEMTTYNSYEEAKIANPESEIVTTGPNWKYITELKGKFERLVTEGFEHHVLEDSAWVKCNPADYCMTFNQCDEFKIGMITLEDSKVVELNSLDVSVLNAMKVDSIQRESWDDCLILSAAALEEKQKPTKFAKVEESIFDLKEEFEKGELYFDVAAVSGGVFFSNDEHVKISSKESLCECYANGNVYRRVEIDWIESVTALVPIGYGVERSPSNKLRFEGSYTKEQALILANAIIESLTDKPE